MVFALSEELIDFLTDDDTNPNLSAFPIFSQIDKAINILGGSVFVKAADRSAKDRPVLDRQIKSARDLVMLIKMSEYLTEGLC